MSVVDKAIYKYTPIILDSIINVDASEIQKLSSNAPIQLPVQVPSITPEIQPPLPTEVPIETSPIEDLEDNLPEVDNTLLFERSDLYKKILGAQDLIAKRNIDIAGSEKLIKEFTDQSKEMYDRINKSKQREKDLSTKLKDITKETSDITKRIRDIKSGKVQGNVQEEEAELKILNLQKTSIDSRITSERQLQTDLEKINKLTEDDADNLLKVLNNKQRIGKASYESLDFSKELLKTEEDLQIAIASGDKDLQNALMSRKDLLTAAQQEAEAQDKINSKLEAARDSIVSFGDKLLNLVPGGKEGFLGKMLGLDTISKNLKDNVGTAMANAFSTAGSGASGFFAAASAGASTLMASLAPILPILLAIAGVVGLVKLFMDADKQVSELAHNLNISYKEAGKLQNTAVDIATEMNVAGMNTAEVTKQMVDLQQATGLNVGLLATQNKQAKDLLATSTMLTTQYGLSAEETMTLNSAAAIGGGTLDKMALAAEKFGEDGLVPAGEIMKDIAKTSKTVLMNFKGDYIALARATKTAKLMGTTLDKMSAAGESLLNIESSITAQNKARMMLGRNINLDAARYYALQGDTEGLMQEMVKAAGSVEDYDKMSVLQKKALAEAMGMQVSDLDEMMMKQKELNTLGIDANKLQEIMTKAKDGTIDLEKELLGMKDDEARKLLKQKVAEQQRAGTQEKLASTIQKVTDLLYKMVEPLLPIIDSFVDSLGNGEGILSSISKTLGIIGSVLGTIFEISGNILRGAWYPIGVTIDFISAVFDKIGKAVKYIKENIFGIKDATGAASKAADDTGKSMEIIKFVALAIGNIIGGWFLLKTLSKAKDGLSSMYDSAKGIGSSLKEGFKSLKEGKFPSLGKKKGAVDELSEKKIETPEVDTKGTDKTLKNTKSFADRLNSMFKSINDTLKAIFKGIGDMLKNIFKFIKDTVKTILDFIKNVMKDIFKTIKDVAKELTSTLQSLLQNIGDLLNTAVNVIRDVGTNLIGAVGDLLGSVIEIIDSQGTALVEALGNIGNTLAEQVMKVVNTLLDGLGQAASKLPGIMNSLGQAIGSFFVGLSTGLVTFAEAMATPTPLFGLPVGLIVLAMAMGIAAALRIAGPGIEALGKAFTGLGKGLGAAAPAIQAAASAIFNVFKGIGYVIESVGKAISTVITAVADSIVKFSDVDAGNIAAVGLSLGALGAGLLALTAGEVVNGIASFFGASPVDTLKELETIDGNKMKVTADGLKSMSDALTNFGNVNTDPIIKSADALDKFNNQVIKGGLADGLNSFLGTDPFAVFTQLAAIDTGKIDTVAKSIALAGTSIESFNAKVGALDDSVGDKGDLIAALLNDIADIEHDEIDALATAIDNLAKSYDSLLASMKNITDDDISRMQQIASATPKDVSGGGIGDAISDTLGSAMSGVKDLASSAISSVGSFFGFSDEETAQETKSTAVATAPITPVMQPVATVNAQPAIATQSETTINNQNNNAKLEGLVRELIAKVEQPVIIKLGEKTVAEMQSAISFRKSYGANVNGYRS